MSTIIESIKSPPVEMLGMSRVVKQIASLTASFGIGVLAGLGAAPFTEAPQGWGSNIGYQADNSTANGSQRGTEPSKEEPSADDLLAQLGLYLRQLVGRQKQIETSSKEDRIAYNLLRLRGYSDSAVECERLVTRQNQLRAATAEIEARIADAKRLQQRLYTVADTAPRNAELTDDLIADIQQYVSRIPRNDPSDYVIPNERWGGGPDMLMKSNQPNHEGSSNVGAVP